MHSNFLQGQVPALAHVPHFRLPRRSPASPWRAAAAGYPALHLSQREKFINEALS